jgi:HD-like signal output (HDOD) protein
MSQIIEQVRDKLIHAIENDQLTLPTLPEVALNVREAAQNPNVTVQSLCSVIERDASITARIIKVSNSPLFRGNMAIENLRTATTRLGINYTCNLATGVAMKQMFQATTDVIDSMLRETWTKSTEIAGIAHALAKGQPRLQADQASLAGLTHRIGMLPILTYAEENRKLLSNVETLEAVIDAIHPEIGARILKAWDFPAELVCVPMEYMNFNRDIAAADYTDLVTVATLQSITDPDHPLAKTDQATVGAFNRLGLNQSADEDSEESKQFIEHIELAVAAYE